MSKNENDTRVLIAITEFSPVTMLWHAALRRLGTRRTNLVALFVTEDHWHQAASLPFTREISRVSGSNEDFTIQRAKELHEEAIARAESLVNQLATEANLTPGFEVLAESDQERIRGLLEGARNVLIAPSFISRRPIYDILKKPDCRIELIEAEDARFEGEFDSAD